MVISGRYRSVASALLGSKSNAKAISQRALVKIVTGVTRRREMSWLLSQPANLLEDGVWIGVGRWTWQNSRPKMAREFHVGLEAP